MTLVRARVASLTGPGSNHRGGIGIEAIAITIPGKPSRGRRRSILQPSQILNLSGSAVRYAPGLAGRGSSSCWVGLAHLSLMP